jgi:NAD(P)-dependent dehydrogenase (short-subunit alcohol dehydrogenase family)
MPKRSLITVFISGANRGIGFGLTKQMSNEHYHIIAGYRNESNSKELIEEARRSDNINTVKVDITQEEDLIRLRNYIKDEYSKLDILINCAGVNVNPHQHLNQLDWKEIEDNFRTNVGGPFLTSKILYPLIKFGNEKKIVNISSNLGSIQQSTGGNTPYRISKAGLNMLMKNQAMEYKKDNIISVSIHPGWVRTDMGGESATMSVHESAKKIISIIENLSQGNSGEFISVHGENIQF